MDFFLAELFQPFQLGLRVGAGKRKRETMIAVAQYAVAQFAVATFTQADFATAYFAVRRRRCQAQGGLTSVFKTK